MYFEHSSGCGQILFNVRVVNHYKSLANFNSYLLPDLYCYRSKSTLRTMWLHHKLHFVHPSGCGHTLCTVGVKNHDKSLANCVSCLLAEIFLYKSELTLRTMSLHHMMHSVHPPGCGHTLQGRIYGYSSGWLLHLLPCKYLYPTP
jgi:hypothetical protein